MRAGVKKRAVSCSVGGFLGSLFTISTGFADNSSPQFISPIDCSVPTECVIQNYVDARPGTGHRDYACGTLSYERHKGTDFRVLSYDLYRQGVSVLAAADGVVVGQGNEANDDEYILNGDNAVYLQEVGNNVVIDHPSGWQTIYAHLKKGTVRVSLGDNVKAGDVIGVVGLSGKTEFPHLHFQVSHNKGVVDPFTGQKPAGCTVSTENSLWNLPGGKEFEYKDTGIIDTGFAGQPPVQKRLAFHSEQKRLLVKNDPDILVFWGEFWGLKIADRLTVRFKNPKGEIVTEQTSLKDNQASYLKYVGKKKPKTGWIPGVYRGEIRLERLVNGQWVVVDYRQETHTLP
ncbi:M23 family metallopeptidase [Kiloniella litopenaei]|uniref:M23 family metallopeptidase n=1 Tax=Kiloniella litopenaei TaxID=1549748 RepID=UPI0006963C51|nr:M23 family metallopeptidase [Kiloniella litopenaei]